MKPLVFIIAVYASLILTCYEGHGLNPIASQNDTAGISGTVNFTGTWPDSTKEVRVAVLQAYPIGMNDPDSIMAFVIDNLVAFSDTIPKFIDQYDYELTLEPDIYGWVVVVWFPDIPVYFFGVKELGAYYQNPDQSDIPTPVNVIPGSITPNINITADFANIERETPFFEIRRRRCPY